MTEAALERRRELVRAAQQRLLRDAGAARTNTRAFFGFVMREETTQRRIRALPFQQLLFRFVDHFDRCVVRMPPGFSKTYTMVALSLWLLGRDETTRGAIVSASQAQAQKPVGMCRDYIENSRELRLVFPGLRPSAREGDPWTQSKITVARPPGIRDPSLTAVGYKGKLPGSRLNWILVDDILTEENTKTKESREQLNRWFASTVLSRRDIAGTKLAVTNTPWHPDDLTYVLEKAGWPTLTIDIAGNVVFTNTCGADMVEGMSAPIEGDFDCDDIRPSVVDPKVHRLSAHDAPQFNPDLDTMEPAARAAALQCPWVDEFDVVPLWPERYGAREIEQLRRDYRSDLHQYNQLYCMRCRDDESARLKTAHIEACKAAARELGIYTFTSKWDIANGRTFTGVDLGIGKRLHNDKTSIFTFAVLPDGRRRILRVDSGRWGGDVTIELLGEHFERYASIIRVETNAGQDFLRQWARQTNRNLPLRGMPTGKNKLSRQHGVESVFIEIENVQWLIPNDPLGGTPQPLQDWIDAMLYYDAERHTGDELMACWIAREQARESGALRRPKTAGRTGLAALGAR